MRSKEFKLLEIELYNVFNYRGRHVIDFRTDSDGNVFLFDIKNGGGKTSLFLAIKWAFYGFDSGVKYEKDGIKLTAGDFINQDERSNGGFHARVRFLYDGKEMRLRRECPDYRNGRTVLTLEVDGLNESGDDAKGHISQIIPPDYGDFFMFNGEILNDMVINQRSKEKVDGVLKLLGLKQLNDLRDILRSIKDGLNDDHYRSVQKNNDLPEIRNQIKIKTEDLSKVKANLIKNDEERKSLQEEIMKLEESRRALSDVEGLMGKISVKSSRKSELSGLIDGTISAIEKNSSNAFLLFIHNDLKDLIARLEEERSEIIREQNTSKVKLNEFSHIQESILAEHLMQCPVCKSVLSVEQIAEMQRMIGEMGGKTSEYEALQHRLNDLGNIIGLLKCCYEEEPTRLNNLCTNLFDYYEEETKIGRDIEEMNQLMSDSEVESVKDISSTLVGLYKKKSNLDAEHNKLERYRKAGESALNSLNSQFDKHAKLDDMQKKVSNRLEFVSSLLTRIDSLIVMIKRQKRSSILNRANEVFMKITNKPDVYSGLQYDDNESFSMHIIRNDGQRVIHPSSGEKHVLAISFLISLSLNTERLNPMMMDTPLSRLDVEHKKNIGKMLSSLDNQVLFLAQPGELDEETRKSLRPAIAKMYESRPTEDNTASIVEVQI